MRKWITYFYLKRSCHVFEKTWLHVRNFWRFVLHIGNEQNYVEHM